MAKSRFRSLAVAAGLASVLVGGSLAWAAGMFSGFPIAGGPSYCSSVSGTGVGTGSGTFSGTQPGQFGQGSPSSGSGGNFGVVCNVNVPAGPEVSGTFLIPADTQFQQGQQPQTVLIPLALAGGYNDRVNRLIGGDFNTNLWQRGTTPVSAASPSTTVMGADRWAVYSSGNVVTVTKQTGASDTIPTLGFYASQRVNRPSGTNNTQICVGQLLDTQASAPLIGNNAVFSFYALAGAGLSAVANNTVQAYIAYHTAADSATPGTNTDSFMKAATTGYTNAVAGGSSSPATTATVASGAASIPITTTWTRYAVYAAIPATNAAGTAITGVGVKLCYTPASGTGASNEWFEFLGAQLQALPSTASALLPAGVTAATGFERRTQAAETLLQQTYSYVLTDGAATVVYNGFCVETTANTSAACTLNFPTTMRITPTTTVGTATSFSARTATGAANACTALTAVSASNTTSSAGLLCTAAGTVAAGVASQFVGAATGGLLTFSAEP